MNAVFDQIAPETVRILVQQAAVNGLSLNDYLQNLLGLRNGKSEDLSIAGFSGEALSENDIAAFVADMEALAEGTEDLPATPVTYSREDIYYDHD